MTDNRPSVILQVDRLNFSHPHREVFADWSASFGPGVSLVQGGDGAGKSTLLRLLAGVIPVRSGCICIRSGLDDVVLAEQPGAYRARVFLADPQAELPDDLVARAWLESQRPLHPAWDAAALERHVEGLGLAPHVDKPFYALSTGTRRKLLLAAALASGATVTLIDDPLAALDRRSIVYLLDALDDLAECGDRAVIVAHAGGPEDLEGVDLAGHVVIGS